MSNMSGTLIPAATKVSGDTNGEQANRLDADSPALPSVSQDTLSIADFLARLLTSGLLSVPEVEQFFSKYPHLRNTSTPCLVSALKTEGLLTDYQVSRLLAGNTFGLVFGNYRTVERLGAGGMGVVYKAEHIHMKRTVAIKVLVGEADPNSVFLQRFYSEMQATAVLSHPNIVLAFDAGEIPIPDTAQQVLRYLVMEYVPGKDLEQYVNDHGPLPIEQACEYIRQAASGLQHAYEHGLVHRDIKPSNLLLTAQNQVKILDFGLARVCRRRHTEAHIMLGSVDYMAPEQARDARSVDIRADIYGLGGIFYWLLTGKKPFPNERPVLEELLARQRESPTSLRALRPDVPLGLEAIVTQMMAVDPGDRYATPLAVLSALGGLRRRPGASVYAPDEPARLRDADLHQAQQVLVFALARMIELRGAETGGHLARMQNYVRVLAEEAARLPAFSQQIEDAFIRTLERSVVLHDVGKVALPDHILLKAGKLDPEERLVMETHTTAGADLLAALARQQGVASGFLQMAIDIARHHHERHDGTGYPDGLAGQAIPMSARIAAIADVYDALRSKLVYKPGLAHAAARRLILETTASRFDPNLLVAFQHCEANLEQVFAQVKD
ncbi:MAG TPA: protein kinase [Gemmataceae bacterium]|nr:protein kinase [Gemmataceae bacterium]